MDTNEHNEYETVSYIVFASTAVYIVARTFPSVLYNSLFLVFAYLRHRFYPAPPYLVDLLSHSHFSFAPYIGNI